MWLPIKLFLSSLGKKKKPISSIRDKKIETTLLTKTRTKISSTKISESNLLFGAMVGIPGHPQLFLSRRLYDSFTWNELEYVILHEAGHYKLRHSLIELTEGIVFFVFGTLILSRVPSPILGAALGLIFGILMIQLAKISELEADLYSLKRMSDPKGMISATEKFFEGWKSKDPKHPVIRFIFYRGNPYKNRIRMAKQEIQRRLQGL
jgi:Zn-dependent protease with chaperone function